MTESVNKNVFYQLTESDWASIEERIFQRLKEQGTSFRTEQRTFNFYSVLQEVNKEVGLYTIDWYVGEYDVPKTEEATEGYDERARQITKDILNTLAYAIKQKEETMKKISIEDAIALADYVSRYPYDWKEIRPEIRKKINAVRKSGFKDTHYLRELPPLPGTKWAENSMQSFRVHFPSCMVNCELTWCDIKSLDAFELINNALRERKEKENR